ncbi:MAG: type II secretion system secretin GspD [Nitrospirae bacterium]|nr:type II secretion system secretin GspD [Nitrospirota bacterium]
MRKIFKEFTACRLFFILLVTCHLSLVTSSFAEAKKAEKVMFNFVDVDLTAVTKFISDVTEKNFIFDERLKGKVTIIAPSKLSAAEAFNLFTSVLELKGFTVIPSGVEAYKIIPVSEAKQRGTKLTSEKTPVNESYIARLLPLQFISSDDALKFLQPVVSKDGHISAFGPGNLLLVIDSGLNIEKIISIVDNIDQPAMREGPEIVFLKYASADAVVKILNEGLGRKGKTLPQPAADEVKAVADSRLNAVILVGDKGLRESMKGLISVLDVPSPEAQGRINVYFLENADAVELGKVMEGMLKGIQTSKPPAQGIPSMTPFEAGSVMITPDKATNSLVIVASPADYQGLSQIIKQLDRRRKQVFVESMIVEASIDKLKEVGAKWRGIVRSEGEPVVIGGVGSVDSNAIQSIISGLSGLTVGGMGNFMTIPVTQSDGTTTDVSVPGFAALFSLSDFKDAVNVLSTPQILTSDNKEAEIVVGENVPFIGKRESDPTRSLSVFSTVDRRDVGITLKITPQITEGDYVKLDLYQEISSVKQDSENIVISIGPTTTKRSAKTSVAVKDNQTVVIGGLMQDRDEDSLTKVPFLGDLPLLGWLFKYKSTSKKKTNLLIFLTPHIIKEAEHLEKITIEKQKEFGSMEKQYMEGELTVKFKEKTTVEDALELILNKDASLIEFDKGREVYRLRLRKGQSIDDAIKEFSAMPEVEYAEPNYKIKIR